MKDVQMVAEMVAWMVGWMAAMKADLMVCEEAQKRDMIRAGMRDDLKAALTVDVLALLLVALKVTLTAGSRAERSEQRTAGSTVDSMEDSTAA